MQSDYLTAESFIGTEFFHLGVIVSLILRFNIFNLAKTYCKSFSFKFNNYSFFVSQY